MCVTILLPSPRAQAPGRGAVAGDEHPVPLLVLLPAGALQPQDVRRVPQAGQRGRPRRLQVGHPALLSLPPSRRSVEAAPLQKLVVRQGRFAAECGYTFRRLKLVQERFLPHAIGSVGRKYLVFRPILLNRRKPCPLSASILALRNLPQRLLDTPLLRTLLISPTFRACSPFFLHAKSDSLARTELWRPFVWSTTYL